MEVVVGQVDGHEEVRNLEEQEDAERQNYGQNGASRGYYKDFREVDEKTKYRRTKEVSFIS